jgi:hypothetical protein
VTFATGQGWQEAVLSVTDLDRWAHDLGILGGWEITHRGAADQRLLNHWRLPQGASAEEMVLVSPDRDERWLRLIKFAGVKQHATRASAQPWDTGGLFSLLTHTQDIEATYATALGLGWGSFNEIDVMTFEGNSQPNVVLRAPDGVAFGCYQFTDRPGLPPKTKFGPPFTSQQMVRDLPAAQSFYEQALGCSASYVGETRLKINQFGMPQNYAGWVPKKVALMEETKAHWGRLELVEWLVFKGRDVSAKAAAPNIGPLALRWGTAAIDPSMASVEVDLAPFGPMRLAALRSPDGAVIELVAAN